MCESLDPTPGGAPNNGADSALTVAEKVFFLLQRGPAPLSLEPHDLRAATAPSDPAQSGPNRLACDEPISLWALREMVLRGQLPLPAINQLWSLLVRRVHAHGEGWTVGAVGMALPALRTLAAELGGSPRRRVWLDLDAEVLSGFLTGLTLVSPTARAIFPTLLRHARAAGLAAIAAHRTAGQTTLVAPTSLESFTHQPDPSTDQIIASAVNAGVLTSADAGLILATRIDGVPAPQVAAAARLSYEAMLKRRRRAERRLAAYLGARSHSRSRRTATRCARPRTGQDESRASLAPLPLPANGGTR
jgi:hypothetical protein